MNDLTIIDGKWINARELHKRLEVGRDFSTWIKSRIEEYRFIKGKDYSPNLVNRSDGLPGKPRQDYLLSIGMAKELCIVENNDKGREIRLQIIKIEEAWNNPEAIRLRAQQMGIISQNALPGSKRPLLEDVREQFEAENVQNDIKNGTTDPPLLQFVLENLEYSPRVSDYIPVKDAYKLYLTYPAENPLPIEQFAIDVCGVPGSNMNICLSKGRLTHCKIKESVPVLRLT
jgi:phage anti-repressor protein